MEAVAPSRAIHGEAARREFVKGAAAWPARWTQQDRPLDSCRAFPRVCRNNT